jgi:hypothetical protein
MIHEAFHAAYENYQPLLDLRGPIDKASLYQLLLQNEGYVVWTLLALRQKNRHPGQPGDPILRDYVVLADPSLLAKHIAIHDQLMANLSELSVDDFLERAFGDDRLVYRVGAAMVREIAEAEGLGAVRMGASMDSGEFFRRYNRLLNRYR